MPLVKATIKSEVKDAFTAVMNQKDDDREGALDKVADKLADAIISGENTSLMSLSRDELMALLE